MRYEKFLRELLHSINRALPSVVQIAEETGSPVHKSTSYSSRVRRYRAFQFHPLWEPRSCPGHTIELLIHRLGHVLSRLASRVSRQIGRASSSRVAQSASLAAREITWNSSSLGNLSPSSQQEHNSSHRDTLLSAILAHPQNLFPTSNSLDTKTPYTVVDRRVPPTRAKQGKFSRALSPNWVCALGSDPVSAYQTVARRLLAPTLPFRMISALWNWR